MAVACHSYGCTTGPPRSSGQFLSFRDAYYKFGPQVALRPEHDLPGNVGKGLDAAFPVISRFISLPFKSCWIMYVDGKVISQAGLFRIEDSTQQDQLAEWMNTGFTG